MKGVPGWLPDLFGQVDCFDGIGVSIAAVNARSSCRD
jgi:hypothetical protein